MRRLLQPIVAIAAIGLASSGASAVAATAPPAGSGATTVHVDGTSPGRTFDGVGALSAGASSRLLIDYPARQRSQILDYLFKPDYGASLQILKVEIGGDTNSTDGTEPSHMHTPTDLSCSRGYEWWLMEQAKQRNPNIVLSALAWGTPGWVGEGQQTVWTDSYTDYLLSWLGCAAQHHLHIDFLGGWNERGYNAAWYVKLRQALDAHGYGYIKIVADDSGGFAVDSALASDAAFRAAVDVIGQHYVCGYLGAYTSCPSPQEAQDFGKPLSASEQGSQPFDTGAAPLARAINRQYIDGRITSTINWALVWSAYQGLPFAGDGLLNANEPWSGHYTIGSSIWTTAQTTQFTALGWRYLDSGSTRIPGGSVVSLRSPQGGDWTSVAETLDATSPQQVTFEVAGGLSTGTVHVWATKPASDNPRDWFVRQPDVRSGHGQFSATLQPGYVYSFTTTNGQAKGDASSPEARGWQLPYQENFDEYATDATPRGFSDLGSTFATAPCQGDRHGTCLRSVVSQQPVKWIDLANYPLTVVGDPETWQDYTVQVDAMLEQSGTVDLGGRVINGVSGYHLTVSSGGTWTLSKVTPAGASTTLASGTASFAVGTWHRLGLQMQALQVTPTIDGKPLATVSDWTYTTGQVSISASAWQNVELDNLSVTRAPGSASRLTLAPSPLAFGAGGDSARMSALVTNPGPRDADGVSVSVQAPVGFTFTPVTTGSATLRRGQSGTWAWQVTAPADAQPGFYTATLALHYQSGGQTGMVTQQLPITVGFVPQAGMTATASSAQPGYPASQAIDGDPATLWHTQYDPYLPLPASITLNLGGSYTVGGLLYQPRTDGNSNGNITNYQIAVSTDGTTFTDVAGGTWPGDATAKSATFARTGPVRYVRLTALSGENGFAAAAEINVIGAPAG